MAKFGNTGSSSLIRESEAALNRTNAYNDAMTSYEFDLSAKTAEDFAKYKSYLESRISKTQNNDPSKALSLTRTATSAYRSFNSAEISRASTAVKYGDFDNRSKYGEMMKLWQAAATNGDDNLAQNIESQMASLSVTIQNEEEAAARRAESANNKALSANKKGIDTLLGNFKDQERAAKQAVAAGQMSMQELGAVQGRLLEQKRKTLEAAKDGKYGSLSEDALAKYKEDHDNFIRSAEYQKSSSDAVAAANGNPNQFLRIDPSRELLEGGYYSEFADMPDKQLATDKNGKVVRLQGKDWMGMSKEDREKYLKSGNAPVIGVVGREDSMKTPTPVSSLPVTDDKGNSYILDQNGNKHYVSTDPNAVLQRSSTPFTDEDKRMVVGADGKRKGLDILSPAAQLYGRDIPEAWGSVGRDFGGALNRIVSGGERMMRVKADKARAEQVALEAAAARGRELSARAPLMPPPALRPAPKPASIPGAREAYNPSSLSPVQNILNTGTGKTPEQRTLSGVGNLIDMGVAANKPAPQPKKPKFSLLNPKTWF